METLGPVTWDVLINKGMLNRIHLLLLFSFSLFCASCSSPPLPSPIDLRCEGQLNPLAAPAEPNLTWRVDLIPEERGQSQSAWQVMVASSRDRLDRGDADLWDSGKMKATRSPQVNYAGKRPSAGQRCYWKVRSWNADGKVSAWSEPAFWEVAPLTPEDWHGALWINDGKANPIHDEDFYENDPAPLLRREFKLSQPVERARLHIAGLGLSYPSLNGKRLSDHPFSPAWTNFEERILFRTLDVTDQLQEGINCIGITLGNGWYNPLPLRMWGRRNLREALPVGRPRGIACLVVDHTDGSQTIVTTDRQWKTTEGPTLRNSIYLGEIRDARKALPGWNQPGFDESGWRPVKATHHSLEPLRPLVMPPTRLQEPFTAQHVTTPKPGVHIVDFGKNFTGLPEVKLTAPAGTRITFRFGELLNQDGTLNPMTTVCGQIKRMRTLPDGRKQSMGGPGAPEIAWQQNVYIASGEGVETYRPDFTFQGFRYMEITGLPEAPKAGDCLGYLLGTDLESAGSFSCSNDLLNQIQEVCRHTFLTNVVSVQSDCPHRERFGYGGDIVATSEAYLMNFDMAGFYAKTVRDWGDAVLPDGRLTDTAPFVGVDYCGVGWAMVHPLLLEQLYQHYGNRDLIEEQFPLALRWLKVEAARREDHLVTKGLGDHEALIRSKGPEFTTPKFVHSALRLARLAAILGQEEEAGRLEQLAEESAAAWAQAFLDVKTGKVGEGTQSSQAFALGFDATPPEEVEKVFAHLVKDLTAPEDAPRLTTGIYGTRILLEALPRMGRNDLAYALATRDTFPSWGWMLENGATTLWESWDGVRDGSRSHNHPMFGSISSYLFRWLGGIQVAPNAVGFDRVLIRPQIPEGLEWVKSSHESIRGTITSNWSMTDAGPEFEIIIPPDTIAFIELPAQEGQSLMEAGRPIDEIKAVVRTKSFRELVEAGAVILPKGEEPAPEKTIYLQVGSGHYRFTYDSSGDEL
jgi:alpha-L-rhamnosidase